MQSVKTLGLTAVCLVLAACQLPAITLQVPVNSAVQPRDPVAGQANGAKLAAVQGTVRVPAGYQGAGGDPFAQAGLISDQGGALISAGGMNYRLNQLQEQPLANALVMLADAAGNPLPDFEPTVTDADGNFRFVRVPQGFTYVLIAAVRKDGKVAYIKGLAQAGGAPVAVDTATTLVTLNLLKETQDGGLIGQLNLASFQEAAKKVAEKLADSGMPDLTDTAGLQGAADEALRAAGVLEVLDALRAEMKQRQANKETELRDQRARGVVVDADGDGATDEARVAPRSCEESFKMRDFDGDGAITWEEMRKGLLVAMEQAQSNQATTTALARDPMELGNLPGEEMLKANFVRLDRDGNGRVTPEEVCEILPIKPPVEVISGFCLDEYKRFDADGDGAVSAEEFMGGTPVNLVAAVDPEQEKMLQDILRRGLKERFIKLDQNQDGKLTPEELCGTLDPCSARFARIAGADALIGPREATLLSWTPEMFKKYDFNGDGFVDRGEFGSVVCQEGELGQSIPVPSACDERFKNVAGVDGFIDLEEAKPLQWDAEMFKKYDRNGDERLDRREFGWAMCQEPQVENPIGVLPMPNPCDERFKLTAGTDGIIDMEEAQRLQWNLDMFKKYDRNADGRVDRREFGWAMCQEPMPDGPITIQPVPTTCDERFKKVAGADGVITIEEGLMLNWSLDAFKKYDRNADGRVDRAEFGWAMCQEPLPDQPITTQPMPIVTDPCLDLFKKMAGDDGRISLEEAKLAQLDPQRMEIADFNRDRFIDEKEYREMFCAGTVVRQ